MTVLNFSVVLGTLYLGGHLMSTGQLTGGDVMAFLINSQTIQRSSAQLSLLFGSVIKGLSAGGRVFEVILWPIDIKFLCILQLIFTYYFSILIKILICQSKVERKFHTMNLWAILNLQMLHFLILQDQRQ